MRALTGTSAFLLLLFAGLAGAADDPGLVSRWQFDREQIEEKFVKSTAGTLDAMIVGPVRFAADKPGALLLEGDAKKPNYIDVTHDIADAGLPSRALAVETWVRIDKPAPTGGIAGALGGKVARLQNLHSTLPQLGPSGPILLVVSMAAQGVAP